MPICKRCNWFKNKYNINCVPYYGPEHPEIVFVGEAFGGQERDNYLKTGNAECFVGAAGEKLNELLKYAGIERSTIGILNSIRCYDENNRTPVKSELDACFLYTYMDLKKLKPKLVVALGETALYQTTGRDGISQHRRKLLWSDKIKCKVMATYHPAACIYDPDKWDLLKEDFLLIKDYINAEPVEIKHYKYEVVSTVERGDEVLEALIADSLPIKLDTETTGLSPYKDTIRIVQVSNTPDLQYIFEADIVEKLKDKFQILLDNVPIEGQDYAFDVKMMFVHYGIFPKIWGDDSCLSEYIIDGMKDNDLTFLTAKYAPESFGYDDEVNKAGGAHKITDKNILYQYGANDIGVLYPVQKRQKKLLLDTKRDWVYYNLTLPTNRVLTKMSLRGVLFDIDEINKVDALFKKRAERSYFKAMNLDGVKACEKHFGKKFNARSSQMIHWLMLQYYELPVLKTNKEDRPSIGQEEMERYAEQYDNEYCRIMVDYRSALLLRDNFLSGIIPKLEDEVAHTNYSLHATNSGRPNSKDPNLLNIPRLKEIKKCIVARPGYKFVYGDFAQLEMRLAAMWYKDEALKAICNDPTKDIHSNITAKAFRGDYEEIYTGYKNGDIEMTELRVAGKTVGFGVIYQEGEQALSYQLKIPVEKAKSFIDTFYSNFPDLKKNIELTKQLVIKQGFIDNYFGFRRAWKFHSEEDHKTQREAVNHPIQSLGFNMLELAMIDVDKIYEKENMKSELVLQVYDSLCTEAPEEEVDEVVHIMKETMQAVNKPFDGINDVMMKVDIKIGETLADF